MDSGARYRMEQDLIFQDLEEKELIRVQSVRREEAEYESRVESLTAFLLKHHHSNGRITTEQAQARVVKALAED
jgi:hypothetical protein